MAIVNLTWTPVNDANSNDQTIQRATLSSPYATIATVAAATSTYQDTTASNDVLYTYKIINNCKVGGLTDSIGISIANPVCPIVTETVAGVEVTLSFPNLSNDLIYQGDVNIDNAIGTYSTGNSNVGQVINFSGEFNTTYNYTFSVSVGEFTASCSGSVTTEVAPPAPCPPPTNLTATVV